MRLHRGSKLIDSDGFRPNVGIIVANDRGQVLWAKRVGQEAWQFPQGGINERESTEQALYRELQEEIGLAPDSVEVVGCTRGWLRYKLPRRLLRQNNTTFIGQKQKWYLLKMLATDDSVLFPYARVRLLAVGQLLVPVRPGSCVQKGRLSAGDEGTRALPVEVPGGLDHRHIAPAAKIIDINGNASAKTWPGWARAVLICTPGTVGNA